VNLDHIESNAHRALCSPDEGLRDLVELTGGQRMRNMPALAERNGARRNRLPGILGRTERSAAFPGSMRRSLTARMCQLDPESRRAAETAGSVQCPL
jgi:hypothetical protein